MEESVTYLKNLIISPKKIRFYLDEIKKMPIKEALKKLYYGKQKATQILYQAIKTALNNAKQTLKVDENLLKFKTLSVDQGFKLKRYLAGSRGGVKPILKRRSHLKIVLVAEKKPVKNLKKKDGTKS